MNKMASMKRDLISKSYPQDNEQEAPKKKSKFTKPLRQIKNWFQNKRAASRINRLSSYLMTISSNSIDSTGSSQRSRSLSPVAPRRRYTTLHEVPSLEDENLDEYATGNYARPQRQIRDQRVPDLSLGDYEKENVYDDTVKYREIRRLPPHLAAQRMSEFHLLDIDSVDLFITFDLPRRPRAGPIPVTEL